MNHVYTISNNLPLLRQEKQQWWQSMSILYTFCPKTRNLQSEKGYYRIHCTAVASIIMHVNYDTIPIWVTSFVKNGITMVTAWVTNLQKECRMVSKWVKWEQHMYCMSILVFQVNPSLACTGVTWDDRYNTCNYGLLEPPKFAHRTTQEQKA